MTLAKRSVTSKRAQRIMRKWASHSRWCFERQGLPDAFLTRLLKTSSRTIHDWDVGLRPVPHWAPLLLELNRVQASLELMQSAGIKIVSRRQIMQYSAMNIEDRIRSVS